MKVHKKLIFVISAITALTGLIYIQKYSKDYVVVKEDKENLCTYGPDGKLTGSTLAMGEIVTVKIPKADFEQYKRDAIAASKCFY